MQTTPSPLSRRRPNYLYSIISVAAVLFLLGFFGLLLVQSRQLVQVLKEQVDIIVELVPLTPDSTLQTVRQRLANSRFVLPESVGYTSREDALAMMSDELGEDLLKLDMPNPLYDIFTFHVRAEYLTADSLSHIREVLVAHPAINDVYYQQGLIEQLAQNRKKVAWLLLGVAILFTALALTVIHNTIRLALYADRFLIKTQELVGASWEFISRPYLRKALWHGLLSALLSIGLLVGLQYAIRQQVPEVAAFQTPPLLGSVFLGLLILGLFISWLSTYRVVRKYLRLREDELY